MGIKGNDRIDKLFKLGLGSKLRHDIMIKEFPEEWIENEKNILE